MRGRRFCLRADRGQRLAPALSGVARSAGYGAARRNRGARCARRRPRCRECSKSTSVSCGKWGWNFTSICTSGWTKRISVRAGHDLAHAVKDAIRQTESANCGCARARRAGRPVRDCDLVEAFHERLECGSQAGACRCDLARETHQPNDGGRMGEEMPREASRARFVVARDRTAHWAVPETAPPRCR